MAAKKKATRKTRPKEVSSIVKTQAAVIRALSDRGITVNVRTLRDWFAIKDCPGKCEHGYDVDQIEQWAAINSEKTAGDSTEAAKRSRQLTQQIKEQELEIKRLKAADMQRADDVAKGNVLPLDECTEMISSIIAVARTELMALPKEVASIVSDAELQRLIVTEGSQRVTKVLEGLAAKLSRVPQRILDGDE